MWVKRQSKYLKEQLDLKLKELEAKIKTPEPRIGFLNLIRDVEYLYMLVRSYEEALNDIKESLTKD